MEFGLIILAVAREKDGVFEWASHAQVGRDNGLVVDRSYADKAPFAFTGTVKRVVFDVAPHPDGKDEDALHAHAHQAHAARGMNA